jgi:hypothetical protein
MFRVHLISERAILRGERLWFFRAVVEQWTACGKHLGWCLVDQSLLYDRLCDAEAEARELERLYVQPA